MLAEEMSENHPFPPVLNMDYQKFLEWANEDVHAEWVNGEVIIQMPAKLVHQVLVGFLYELLSFYIRLFDLGKVCLAPYEVKLTEGAAREPDLFFVLKENLNRLTEDRLIGAPDLAIEVVSKSSVKHDRDDKFNEYREAGVHEYWIIDPRLNKQRADFYRLSKEGIYRLYATEEDEWVSSDILTGFRLRPTWLWKANILNPIQCNFEIEGVSDAFNKQMNKFSTTD